jgi:diguanylate cyclase (GGDEF)-like protein
VPAKPEVSQELAGWFAECGVEAFLGSTSSLVAILDSQGNLLSWNAAFGQLKPDPSQGSSVKEFLSSPSRLLFEQFLTTSLGERTRKQVNLEFAWASRWGDFSSLFIPLTEDKVLFIAEPVHAVADLETITAELEKIKRSLAIKETELQAVIAQADEVSHTDALTFLPNRKSIISGLQHEAMFADKYGTPLAISLIDIDYFKTINDTYGHVAGDEILRKLAMELRGRIRHPDVIGRYGGEEFLVVLPHSTSRAAVEQAERLRKHVQTLVIPFNDSEIRLTISLGIAQYKPHREDWQEFLSRADAALYQAKNNGRNQWVVAKG